MRHPLVLVLFAAAEIFTPAVALETDGPSNSWIVLYDVSRDGIRAFPTLPFLLLWIAGDLAAASSLRTRAARRQAPVLLWIWLLAWNVGWGFAITTQLSWYVRNETALKTGNVKIAEGAVTGFHRQDYSKKGDLEQFTINGELFRYSNAVLGSGGMRSSKGFDPPLQEGLYVKVYYRDGVILKVEARRLPNT